MAEKKKITAQSFVPRRFWAITKANFTRGNLIQLAIAFVLGTAFNAIVVSLANDIILGAIYVAVPKLFDISKATNAGINYGKFIAAILIFIIDVLFISVLMYVITISMTFVNRNKPKPVPPPPMASNNDLLAELKAVNTNLAMLYKERNSPNVR